MNASNEALPESLRDPMKCLERGRIVEMRQEIFQLCEVMEDQAREHLERVGLTEHQAGFYRGQRSAAKQIRNAIGEVMRTTLGKENKS